MIKKVTILFLFIVFSIQAGQDEALDVYNQAKKKRFEQKWQEAVEIFDRIIEDYTDSRYTDDAIFWKGYCLEKMPGRQMDAFDTYEHLISQYQSSSWIDDATIHQIELAEYFESHARRIYMLKSDIKKPAHHLLKHLKNDQLKNPFSLSDFRTKGWAGLNKPEERKNALETLASHNYLNKVRVEADGNSKKTKSIYYINPEILDTE